MSMRARFVPILAGASLPDRLFACLGALAGIALTSLVSALLVPGHALVLLAAPMGASAVLVFAVPASPLAQPWPVIGGNVLSALVGIMVARLVPAPEIGVGLAVGGAILVMSLTRSLHPPGGASALIGVIGGPAVAALGYRFVIVPVALNAVLLVATGIAFHRLSRHSYPHRPAAAPPFAHPEDIDLALAELGETLDVDRDDLDRLFARVEHHAARRVAPRR
jgi:CBS domain-containing membrane protein